MTTNGDRLRSERERLNINLSTFAKLIGVARSAQTNYELGERSPNAEYFERVAKIGVDILYVITGIRSGEPEPLTLNEMALLNNYRQSQEDGRRALEAASAALAQCKTVKNKAA